MRCAGSLGQRLARPRSPQAARCAAAGRARELDELLLRAGPRLGVALAHVRHEHLPEQRRFALGEVRYIRRWRASMPCAKNPAASARPRARRRRTGDAVDLAGRLEQAELSSSATCASVSPAAGRELGAGVEPVSAVAADRPASVGARRRPASVGANARRCDVPACARRRGRGADSDRRRRRRGFGAPAPTGARPRRTLLDRAGRTSDRLAPPRRRAARRGGP